MAKRIITIQLTIDPTEHGAEDNDDSAISLAIRIMCPVLQGTATFHCGDITRLTLPTGQSLLPDERPHFEETLHGMAKSSF